MKKILKLAEQFRNAMDEAKQDGVFTNHSPLCCFPRGCCTVASALLAQFLLEHRIRTFEIRGIADDGSPCGQPHEWLITQDDIMIDITGDQFRNNDMLLNYDKPAFVGIEDNLHKMFVIESDIIENRGLNSYSDGMKLKLAKIYNDIIKYI